MSAAAVKETEPATETLRDGRYAVMRVLGEGSQGATLEAIDKSSGRVVAIKRFTVRGAKSWKDVELAEREARVLATLSHPALPQYLDHFEEAGCLYLVMERIEGESLLELRRRGEHLSQQEVVKLLADVGDVLSYLHTRAPPVIHRDIKPGNVIRRSDGRYCIVDFGSVRDRLKPEGGSTVVGTFGYMGPEQFQGRALAATDVYGLGATALVMLTGQEPEQLPHRGLAVDVERALGASVDRRLTRALRQMLEPDPERRASLVLPLVQELLPRQAPPRAPSAAPERGASSRSERRGPRHERDAWRKEVRRERDEWRHAARRERDEWRKQWRSGRRPTVLPPLLVVFLLLGLGVARVAVWASFRLALPLLLTLLSVLFGSGLRRAAQRLRQLGLQGNQGLQRAARYVRERSHARERAQTRPPPARTRVEPEARHRVVSEPIDVEAYEVEREAEAELSEESSKRRARR